MLSYSASTGLPLTNLDRVLAAPELLDIVLSFLHDKDNANNARVSKRWSQAALDVLWRRVDDVSRLFELLTPLVDIGEGSPLYAFRRIPEPSDWERFNTYARRVRHLEYDESHAKRRLAAAAWDDVARTRPALTILPNLAHLTWLAPPGATDPDALRHSVTFMHARVQTFAVRVPSCPGASPYPTAALQSYVQHVLARMPLLVVLDVRMQASVRAVQAPVLQLLAGLPALTKVVLPAFWLTSDVMETLSCLPALATAQFELFLDQGAGDKADVACFAPVLKVGAFPALRDLSLSARLADVRAVLAQPHAPRGITHLFVHSPHALEPPESIHAFLDALPAALPQLTHLYLELRDDVPVDPAELRACSRATLDTLRPLLTLPTLRVFELYHARALALSEKDLDTLARGLPHLTHLQLNPEPALPAGYRAPGLGALLPFAQHCPRLAELGLFLDVRPAPAGEVHGEDLPRFAALRTLNMGVSAVEGEDSGEVALWLSRVCPRGCRVASGYTWEAAATASEGAVERCRTWDEVDKMLPLLTSLRVEEHERRRVLEKEVDDLRVRNGVLMGMAGMRLPPS